MRYKSLILVDDGYGKNGDYYNLGLYLSYSNILFVKTHQFSGGNFLLKTIKELQKELGFEVVYTHEGKGRSIFKDLKDNKVKLNNWGDHAKPSEGCALLSWMREKREKC